MKHLIFVSVAAGFFSGTSISANAQAAVNSVADTRAINKSPQFIEGIEIRPETSIPPRPPLAASSKDKNTAAARLSARNEASAIEQCSSLQFKYAQLLNMDVEAVTNIELYSFMEKWWGTPYRYGGATKDGIDCSAYSGTLVHDVYGMILSRTARSQYAECEKIKKKYLQEGDLVFFKNRRAISHVGIYLGNGYFTHASTSNGVIISSLDEAYYSKRYAGGGRIALPSRSSE
ncbi:MAG: C40 family peptidase [Ferruginibacter sp.]|nr:C40 family peptidase [Ferruginibacter sp.]MBU9935706.1 C40 family peptidase [Ferruginibacter sp.]HQY10823.1 C40 family peptidase [Ferruginibacter sp.]